MQIWQIFIVIRQSVDISVTVFSNPTKLTNVHFILPIELAGPTVTISVQDPLLYYSSTTDCIDEIMYQIKRPRLMQPFWSLVFEWSIPVHRRCSGTDHSKTKPFENRTLKRSVFEWIQNLIVQNSSPDGSVLLSFKRYGTAVQCLIRIPTVLIGAVFSLRHRIFQ